MKAITLLNNKLNIFDLKILNLKLIFVTDEKVKYIADRIRKNENCRELSINGFYQLVALSYFEYKYFISVIKNREFLFRLFCYLRQRQYFLIFFYPRLYLKNICDDIMLVFSNKLIFRWEISYNRLVKSILIEESMAWLSTLGGGYSSLGDRNDNAVGVHFLFYLLGCFSWNYFSYPDAYGYRNYFSYSFSEITVMVCSKFNATRIFEGSS